MESPHFAEENLFTDKEVKQESTEDQQNDKLNVISKLTTSLRYFYFPEEQKEKTSENDTGTVPEEQNIESSGRPEVISSNSTNKSETNLDRGIISGNSAIKDTAVIEVENNDLIDLKENDDYLASAPMDNLAPPDYSSSKENFYNKQLHNEFCYPDIIAQISTIFRSNKNHEKLKPYSEAEMSMLYYNQELGNHDLFVSNFIEAELKNVVRHPLHELLSEYFMYRDNLCKNNLEFDCLIEHYKQYQEQIWSTDTSSCTEFGECQDGNPVSATHQYKVSHFNEYIYKNFTRNVNQLEILTSEPYAANVFNLKLYQIKIEHFVESLCYHFSFVPPNAPILLYNDSVPRGPLGTDFEYVISELKCAISVLFSFQRRPTKDDSFILETRKWLEKLVSVLLRVSTANDHLFIMHHVARCPAGIGKWASHFVQLPVSNSSSLYNQQYVDHVITTLAAILLPVKSRDLFLQQMEAGLEENGMWVIIDSDGEDSEENLVPKTALKENDLVSILNQIPFADIFRQIILVNNFEQQDIYDVNSLTDRDILRSIAISTLIINILEKGIANYNALAYKQFCKRLSRLMKHTASYVTDHWQMFRETYTQRSIVDSAMLNRLHTEYDEFLLRVVNSLYSTFDRIGWQYLATLPFGMITSHTLWRLYQYFLHTNSDNNVLMSEEFMENLARLPDNDIYYFLTTITNMALVRGKQDWVFIQTVVLQLFCIGFVNVNVRDDCMKPARILIANLTSKHPSLISDLILALKKDFVLVGKFSLYLFKELPVSLWKPNSVDILAFNEWFLNYPLTSWENNLTMYIISQLNWSMDLNGTDLFLSRDMHCQIAIMTVKALYKYAEEISPIGSSAAIISLGVRQMSSMVRSQSPEQTLNFWAWQTLSKLKLHLLDQPDRVVRMTLTDLQTIAQIPDINSDTAGMRVLSDGIIRNQSVAYYVTLLMSNVGHSLPVICETCWDYCNILLSTYKYSQVLHVLQLTLPYFLSSIESLLKLEKFQAVILKLLLADQTYMKIAKNLIVSDFPGLILSQFAALIQYHIKNYSRYCLHNANQMIEMWLRILCSAWGENNCSSATYLMDTILSSTSAFTDNTLKQMIIEILSELIQNVSPNRYAVTGGLSSLVSWIGYNSSVETVIVPSSLLPRSSTTVTHSPYFAFFALFLEEYFTQIETQLWSEVLKNLSLAPGKANVDYAVKKACLTLKLNPINSNWLAIYRWSQYALDLSSNHPILPLFWQRFFKLYLQRVPANNSGVAVECVGRKFFEGAVNGVYFKKIKKKLQDCSNYFAKKNTNNDEQEKNFYNHLHQLYKSFILWLDEPRLQEPDVFLPALPPSYNVAKLSDVINGEENLWLEYVNFDKIKSDQKTLTNEWMKILYRVSNSTTNRIICFPEDVNVVDRLLKRLHSYDQRLPPPELTIKRPLVPEIPRETFLNKALMLDTLNEHFQCIIQFARSYEIEKSEQNNAASKLLEAFRCLFTAVEIEVKYLAACDTASATNKRRTVSTIHCAGPASIVIHIREGRLNKCAKHTIERCDIDFQRLLKHNVRTPSDQLLIACIVIVLAAQTLCKERIEVEKIGDITLLNTLQEVGVSLFYKLIFMYDGQVSEYFPTKMLIKKIIDRLGQSFIDNIDTECSKLLSTILNNPHFSTLLIPHFTPCVMSAAAFVRLYLKVVTEIPSKDVNFILNLITKFNVKMWLNNKKPKLADRSELIEVLSLALKDIGSQPTESLLSTHKILRRDLCEILMYDFPEHYGEILHVVLKYSAEEKFSCDVWFDLLNSLLISSSAGGGGSNLSIYTGVVATSRPGLSILQIRDIARKYATDLRTLTFYELVETANMLGGNFLKERLQYGLYGLYPKYSIYIEPIMTLHSMVGHAIVTSILRVQKGTLADELCEKIWPVLVNLFSPWIIPYFTGNLQEPPAPWIQQLTDDRSVLLPWVETDKLVASKMMATFVECLKFILDALPASGIILSYVCQWYIAHYAHTSVKEHILTVVQNNLITLNWTRYQPTLMDLELILKIVDQYLPACHSFLGSIFIEILWNIVVQNEPTQSATRIHVILLNLSIKLANEPNLRQSGKVTTLLIEAQQFYWHLVDSTNYELVLNWFVMSYDPRVILQLTDEDWNGIDMAAFELLQVAAGYDGESASYHPTTLRKRQMFIKACVKLINQLANRYKTVLAVHHVQMEAALTKMLDKMELVITRSVVVENKGVECALLLSELLSLINQPSGSALPKLMIKVLLNWLNHRAADSPVLQGLLRTSGTVVNNHLHLGIILEACLSAWFKNSAGMEEYDWNKVLSVLQVVATSHLGIEEVLLANNQILALYALTLKQTESDNNFYVYGKIIQCITCLKPSGDNESKLPLLWSFAFKDCTQNVLEFKPSLLKLSNYFQQIINMKPGWGLFGVIGMNKQTIPSLKCKVLCYALITFITIKLNDEQEEEISNNRAENKKSKNIGLINAECTKSISTLENLINDKHYAEYRVTIEFAVRLIKSKEITLNHGEKFIIELAKQLYTEGYIHAFRFQKF